MGGRWAQDWGWDLEELGGPTLTACGPRVAIQAVALPTDGVAVSPSPTVTAQGTTWPKKALSAIKVTGGPHAPWGAKAVASDRVTGHPTLAVTLLAAALSE